MSRVPTVLLIRCVSDGAPKAVHALHHAANLHATGDGVLNNGPSIICARSSRSLGFVCKALEHLSMMRMSPREQQQDTTNKPPDQAGALRQPSLKPRRGQLRQVAQGSWPGLGVLD